MMVKINNKESGKKLKLQMVKRGIQAKALAKDLGYSDSSTINRWIRGETTPSYENLVNMAIILRCNVKDLVVFSRETTNTD